MLLARLHTLHHLEAQNVGAARGCCKLLAGAFRDAALTWLISGLRAPDLPGAAPGCLRARFQREHSRSSSWKGHESGLEG